MTCLIGAKRSPADRRVEAAADLREARLQTSNLGEPAEGNSCSTHSSVPSPSLLPCINLPYQLGGIKRCSSFPYRRSGIIH